MKIHSILPILYYGFKMGSKEGERKEKVGAVPQKRYIGCIEDRRIFDSELATA